MVLEWNVFEDVCSIGFDLYSSQHQEGLRQHVHGGGGKVSCQDQLCNWHVRLPISCQGQHNSFYTLSVLNVHCSFWALFFIKCINLAFMHDRR